MANCVILYGNTDFPAGPKSAGPFRIATELRDHGYSVQTIDISVFDTVTEDFKKILSAHVNNETIWVGISVTFLTEIFQYPFSLQLIDDERYEKLNFKSTEKEIQKFINLVKSLNPKTKLIYGGAKNYRLDILGFVKFEKYVDKEIIDYTDWLSGKSNKINLEFYTNKITGQEFEGFVHSSIKYEKSDIVYPSDVLPIEVSRGCIFKCKFCSYPLNGKTKGEWIKKTQVLKDEFQRNYDQFGVTNYSFTDDTYNDSVDKLKLLYDEVYSKLNFKIKFASYIRLDLLVTFPETVEILRESGLKSAVCGMESINPKSAKSIGKGMNPQKQIDFVREIKKEKWKDVLVSSNFIIGLPHDTKETINELENWLLSADNPFDYWYVFPLGIFPSSTKKSWYQSEFDLNYEKYGYEIVDYSDKYWYVSGWKNEKNGLDYTYVNKRSKEILRKSSTTNWKYGGWYWTFFQEFINDYDITNLSVKDIHKKYNFPKLIKLKQQNYIDKLLEISYEEEKLDQGHI